MTRIFGGDASKEGTVFLASGGRGAATSDEATIYLGGALEPGNDASKRATATIPAGTVVLVGLSREIQLGVYRDVVPYLGGRPIVELADVTEAARVKYGATSPLPPNPAAAFRRDGLPLKLWRTSTVADQRVVEFETDPAVMGVKRVRNGVAVTGMFLYVLVFDDSRAAARGLRDARERAVIRSFGMTVVHRRNVVAEIFRGDATKTVLKNVTHALDAATGVA